MFFFFYGNKNKLDKEIINEIKEYFSFEIIGEKMQICNCLVIFLVPFLSHQYLFLKSF